MAGRASLPKPASVLITAGPDGGTTEVDMNQCCHCGRHVQFNPRAHRGGWCFRCQGFVCGPQCADCIPTEKQIENIEAGKPMRTPGIIRVSMHDGTST